MDTVLVPHQCETLLKVRHPDAYACCLTLVNADRRAFRLAAGWCEVVVPQCQVDPTRPVFTAAYWLEALRGIRLVADRPATWLNWMDREIADIVGAPPPWPALAARLMRLPVAYRSPNGQGYYEHAAITACCQAYRREVEELEWLRKGRFLLADIRRYLRARSRGVSQSPRRAYTPEVTLPTL